MNPVNEGKAAYLDTLAVVARQAETREALWLRALRRDAVARFDQLGFPTTRNEEWKYTDIAPIVRAGFTPAPRDLAGADGAQLSRYWFENLPGHKLVFVNGCFSAERSRLGALPKGATVASLAEALIRQPQVLEVHFGRIAGESAHAFTALNTALAADGVYIHLAPGVQVEQPIHLLYVVTPAAGSKMLTPRNLIVAEEGSRAAVIEHYVTLGAAAYFTNALTEVAVGPNAAVEHYRLQEEAGDAYHVGGLHVRLGRDSRLTAHAVDLGGRLVRNDVRAALEAEGAECTLNGLYVVGGRGHVDNHTHIDHAKPHGTSREFYKGVLDGRARAVFRGRIVVHPDAQHTDARQVNNNLLLSRDAEADSQPQLEIYADDVKCAHGATVGSLDEDALFYLRSRAIEASQARELLTYAFARDVLARIALAPVRERLERRLIESLMHRVPVEELL